MTDRNFVFYLRVTHFMSLILGLLISAVFKKPRRNTKFPGLNLN